jgi:hypothetical protein
MAITKHPVPPIFQDGLFKKILPQLQYWRKGLHNYACHLFVLCAKTEADFTELWEPLTAKIAVLFQSELKANIEIWNIYLVILVKERVSREVKYKVEQNKYCCRKLVEDNLLKTAHSDEEITALLEAKIFNLDIVGKPIADELLLSTTASFLEGANEADIVKLLTSFQSNQQFDKYYQRYKKLQK